MKKTKKELAEEKKQAANQQKKVKREGLWGLLVNGSDQGGEDEGGVDVSIGNVLRLMLFTHRKESNERDQLIRIANSLDTLAKRLDHIEG